MAHYENIDMGVPSSIMDGHKTKMRKEKEKEEERKVKLDSLLNTKKK